MPGRDVTQAGCVGDACFHANDDWSMVFGSACKLA
jgi:hypothetical protein